ncbi:hypothetical protein ACQYAD_06715 [Neobacillus sp. SM06]
MKKKAKDTNVREEFSVEFGDINGTKLLDFPLMEKVNTKKSKKKDKPV